MNIQSYLTTRNIAAFILLMFCIQYIPLESRDGVSYLKLGIAAMCPFIYWIKTPFLSRCTWLLLLYYVLVIFAAITHPASLRWSTVLFLSTFLMTYATFYNLVTINKVFTREYAIKFIRYLIIVYMIVLLLQQCLLVIGIKIFPLFNLVQDLGRGLGANSLTYEPSSIGVILAFAFLSLLRLHELDYGRKLTINEIFSTEKWATIAFFYTMIGAVSGTAMISLFIVCFYFLSSKQKLYTIPALIILLFLFLNIDYLPLNRARDSMLAFLSLDRQKVMIADRSAATRIIPAINTLTNLDLTTWDGWFGHGVDYGLSKWIFSDRVMIGSIADYGFLSFIVMQIVVYSCMIKRIFSLESVLWVIIGTMTLANIPLNWGAMMLFTLSRHFQTESDEQN